MKDKEFLQWIYNRLKKHGEDYHKDYMNKLRCIIASTDEDKETPNTHIPDWDEMRDRVEQIDKGDCIQIPKGLSREELRDFMNGNFSKDKSQ